jgi:VanZ family protein
MIILRRVLMLLLAAYWLFILTLTHVPKLPAAAPKVDDKVAHYLAYGALTGLLFLTLWVFKPLWKRTPWIVLAIVLAYGAIDERTQPWFGRTCDLHDWYYDAAAALTAVAILAPIHLVVWKRLDRARRR